MRLTAKELEQMKSVDIGAVAPESLPDVSGMTFDTSLPREERIALFLQAVENPYCFCIGGTLPEMRVSIKTRIGKNDPAEWPRLLDIYARYPVAELIVHPRLQKEFYRGAVHRDAFDAALAQRQDVPVYNGDLFTAADVAAFCRQYPQVDAVMVGRGLIADPALGRRLRGGAPASRQELTAFHDRLLADYRQRLSGDTPVLHRMRELWNYLSGSFERTERELKAIRKAKTVAEYLPAAQRLLRDCPLRENAVIEV